MREPFSENFIGFDHGNEKIVMQINGPVIFAKPVEIHLKRDGSTDDKETFAFVLHAPTGHKVVGELSLRMWNEGLADVGYKIVKIKNKKKDEQPSN